MKKIYSKIICNTLLTIALTCGYSVFAVAGFSAVDSSKVAKPSSKITDTRKDRPAASVKLNIVPFKPTGIKDLYPLAGTKTRPAQDNDKILSNVKVYPNPVEDQLNLSYHVNKDSNVTIKLMDVLGNEIATLFSQKLPAGEQSNSFNISSRLTSGFYFIRLVVGNETIVKRISVL